jgi:hypothetical protein
LEVVRDVKKQIDGAAGVRGRDDALAIAGRLKVNDSDAGRKDSPIHRIGEGLLLREAEAGARRRQDRGILAARPGR